MNWFSNLLTLRVLGLCYSLYLHCLLLIEETIVHQQYFTSSRNNIQLCDQSFNLSEQLEIRLSLSTSGIQFHLSAQSEFHPCPISGPIYKQVLWLCQRCFSFYGVLWLPSVCSLSLLLEHKLYSYRHQIQWSRRDSAIIFIRYMYAQNGKMLKSQIISYDIIRILIDCDFTFAYEKNEQYVRSLSP